MKKNTIFMTYYLCATLGLTSLTGCATNAIPSYNYSAIVMADDNIDNISEEKLTNIQIDLDMDLNYNKAYSLVDDIKNSISEKNIGMIYITIDNHIRTHDEEDEYLNYVGQIADKLLANGIKFILIGEDKQLEKLVEHNDQYMTMIVCNSKKAFKTKKKDENYDIIYYKDKVYYKKGLDLTNIKNDDSHFVEDYEYTIQSGDTLVDIAENFDIDYEELGEYNCLDDFNLIYDGQTIIIPSKYDNEEILNNSEESFVEEEKEEDIKEEYEETSHAKVDREKYDIGIDVSQHNGEIDWEKASEEIDFAIVRIGDAAVKDEDGNYLLDKRYRENMAGCEENNINTGLYYFTRAHSKEEMKKEISFVLESLKAEDGHYYRVNRPIYIDVEEGCAEELTYDEESRIAQVERIIMFCEAMEEMGYATGVYINADYIDKLDEIGDRFSIWGHGGDVSGWLYNTSQEIDSLYYGHSSDDEYFTSTSVMNVIQSTSRGKVDFAEGNMDLDYANKDFFKALSEMFSYDEDDSLTYHN